MKIVDRRSPRKLYLQLYEIIKEAIDRNELQTGEQLPTEERLCGQHGVSKAVVRAALLELTRKGYICRIPGKGTFIQKPTVQKGVWLLTQITEQILDFGIPFETEVIQKMLSVAPSDLSELFSSEGGHQVFKVIRLRSVAEQPCMLETAYVSHDLCPGLPLEDLKTCSMIEIINERYGIPITRCADSIEITTLEDKEASLLRKQPNDQALLVDRIFYTTNNRVVAFIRILSTSADHRITFESIRS